MTTLDWVGKRDGDLVLFLVDTFSRLMYLDVKFHFTEVLLMHALDGQEVPVHGLMGRTQ